MSYLTNLGLNVDLGPQMWIWDSWTEKGNEKGINKRTEKRTDRGTESKKFDFGSTRPGSGFGRTAEFSHGLTNSGANVALDEQIHFPMLFGRTVDLLQNSPDSPFKPDGPESPSCR